MSKLDDLQRLRTFAILMVLFGHTGLAFPDAVIHGYTGVSLFFVISGYVVTLSIIRRLPGRSTDRRETHRFLRDFYIRRVFRIVPVAAFWVLASVVIAEGLRRLGSATPWVVPWTTEVKWMLSGAYNYFFAARHVPAMFGHYWSLAVEMHFYLVLPILLLVIRDRRSLVGACVMGVVGISTAARMVTPAASIGFLTHTQADALLMGVLLCVLSVSGRKATALEHLEARLPVWTRQIVFLVLATALLVLPSLLDNALWHPAFKYPLYTTLATLMVFLGQRERGWVPGGRVFSYLGDRSFSLYLCHPILWIGLYPLVVSRIAPVMPSWMNSTGPGVAAQFTVMLVVAILVSELSYRFIEVPYINHGKAVIRALRERTSSAVVPDPTLAAMVEESVGQEAI